MSKNRTPRSRGSGRTSPPRDGAAPEIVGTMPDVSHEPGPVSDEEPRTAHLLETVSPEALHAGAADPEPVAASAPVPADALRSDITEPAVPPAENAYANVVPFATAAAGDTRAETVRPANDAAALSVDDAMPAPMPEPVAPERPSPAPVAWRAVTRAQ